VKRDPSHLLDAALPLLAAAIIAGAILARPDGGVWPLALGVPAALVLFLRHRATTVTLVVSAALALALFAVDHSAGAIAAIAPAAALYSFALEHRRLHLIVATSVAVVAVVVADVFLAGGEVATLQTALHVLLIATPLLAAEALRNRRSYVKVLLERLELIERTREEEAQRRVEQERLRIARDMHDIVAHSLTTINVQAGVAAYLLERDPEHVKGALTTIQKASHDALDELRGLLGVLRDADGERAPLQPTPGLEEIAALVDQTRQSGVAVTLAIEGEQPAEVPGAVQLAAYRIVQESLTNARRHAPGQGVVISLAFEPDRLRVVVENDQAPGGTGSGETYGVGIRGMRERAAALGGTLEAGPQGGTFRVTAELPYERQP
jgi:signal transduction histidine kinase